MSSNGLEFYVQQCPMSYQTNVRHYQDKMMHLPKYMTNASEFADFQELTQLLLKNSVLDDRM